MATRGAVGEIAVAAVHALTGWALAAPAMSLALWKTRAPEAALSAHAVAVPVAFALVSFVYFRRTHVLRPLAAATLFAIVVVAMDALALRVFHRATDARALVLGVALPAFVALLSVWLFGIASSISSQPHGDEMERAVKDTA